MSASVVSVISRFLEEYLSSTPQRLKLLDAYLLYILLTGALQFGYCLLVGTFPFNSFLSGFISCVGSFILAGNDSLSSPDDIVLLRCAALSFLTRSALP
jgi:oligosaccharyltransferase complex subunit epsilon